MIHAFPALSRRQAIATLAGGFVAARALGMQQPAPERTTVFEWETLQEGARVARGFGGNALLITNAGETLLVDCKNMPMGVALRREAAQNGGGPTMVVNTHHHADHTGGNPAFVADLPVTCQEKAVPRIAAQVQRYIGQYKQSVTEAQALPDAVRVALSKDFDEVHGRIASLKAEDFTPNRTFSDHAELRVGGLEVSLHHFGAGHTDNDAIVSIPSLHLLHTGDLLFRRVHPYFDRDGGATSIGWTTSLKRVIELCDDKTVVIPGHGATTDIAGIREQIDYLDRVLEFVASKIKEGRARSEILELKPPEPYGSYGLDWIRPITLGGMYDELTAKS